MRQKGFVQFASLIIVAAIVFLGFNFNRLKINPLQNPEQANVLSESKNSDEEEGETSLTTSSDKEKDAIIESENNEDQITNSENELENLDANRLDIEFENEDKKDTQLKDVKENSTPDVVETPVTEEIEQETEIELGEENVQKLFGLFEIKISRKGNLFSRLLDLISL